jgi:hypothetical protein
MLKGRTQEQMDDYTTLITVVLKILGSGRKDILNYQEKAYPRRTTASKYEVFISYS